MPPKAEGVPRSGLKSRMRQSNGSSKPWLEKKREPSKNAEAKRPPKRGGNKPRLWREYDSDQSSENQTTPSQPPQRLQPSPTPSSSSSDTKKPSPSKAAKWNISFESQMGRIDDFSDVKSAKPCLGPSPTNGSAPKSPKKWEESKSAERKSHFGTYREPPPPPPVPTPSVIEEPSSPADLILENKRRVQLRNQDLVVEDKQPTPPAEVSQSPTISRDGPSPMVEQTSNEANGSLDENGAAPHRRSTALSMRSVVAAVGRASMAKKKAEVALNGAHETANENGSDEPASPSGLNGTPKKTEIFNGFELKGFLGEMKVETSDDPLARCQEIHPSEIQKSENESPSPSKRGSISRRDSTNALNNPIDARRTVRNMATKIKPPTPKARRKTRVLTPQSELISPDILDTNGACSISFQNLVSDMKHGYWEEISPPGVGVASRYGYQSNSKYSQYLANIAPQQEAKGARYQQGTAASFKRRSLSAPPNQYADDRENRDTNARDQVSPTKRGIGTSPQKRSPSISSTSARKRVSFNRGTESPTIRIKPGESTGHSRTSVNHAMLQHLSLLSLNVIGQNAASDLDTTPTKQSKPAPIEAFTARKGNNDRKGPGTSPRPQPQTQQPRRKPPVPPQIRLAQALYGSP